MRYLGKQDQIWANVFCIPKNMHSRTLITTITDAFLYEGNVWTHDQRPALWRNTNETNFTKEYPPNFPKSPILQSFTNCSLCELEIYCAKIAQLPLYRCRNKLLNAVQCEWLIDEIETCSCPTQRQTGTSVLADIHNFALPRLQGSLKCLYVHEPGLQSNGFTTNLRA